MKDGEWIKDKKTTNKRADTHKAKTDEFTESVDAASQPLDGHMRRRTTGDSEPSK